jgi:glycosyltransferase involved in cell wall biosynthesis
MTGSPAARIAIFIPTLTGGGVEKNMVNLSRAFVDRGHPVDLVLANATGPLVPLVDPRINLVDLGCARVVSALWPLRGYLRAGRPTVLLAGMGHANLVALAARWLAGVRCRVVVSVHTVLSRYLDDPELKRAGLVPHLARFAYPRAFGIVAVSNAVADDLARISHLDRDSIRVIGNPVLTPEVRAGYSRCPAHPFFGPDQPPVVLSVGRLDRFKGFDVLIEAHARLRDEIPHRLLILGEGPDRDELVGLAAERGVSASVDLPGFVDDVPGYLARSRAFALASRVEGFGNVLVEALGGGVPVVATDCIGGPRDILADGRYGRLVPVDDPAALAEALAAALTETVDAEALKRRAEDFSLENIAAEYLDGFGLPGGG